MGGKGINETSSVVLVNSNSAPLNCVNFDGAKCDNIELMEEKEQNALEEQDDMIKDILSQHGSPSDPNDQLKVLEQVMFNSERDISIFIGALDLLKQQLMSAKKENSCPVCFRLHENRVQQEDCIEQIDIKMQETRVAMETCEVQEVYKCTKLAMPRFGKQVTKDFLNFDNKSIESRVMFNMRSGALTEMRNQKAECLQGQGCFACLRYFRGNDAVNYLQRVDRIASQMQGQLHVHN